MRMLGGWIALTPELAAKLLFGRHVWDCAQHADLWGRRLPELRAPAQQSEPANDRSSRSWTLIETAEGAGRRRSSASPRVYRVLKPHLATVYERHLAVANPVYEPPTRRILAALRGGGAASRRGRRARARRDSRPRDPALATRARRPGSGALLEALAAAGGVTGDAELPLIVPPAAAARSARRWRRTSSRSPPAFDPRAVLGDLAAPLEAHRRALAARRSGDRAGASWSPSAARRRGRRVRARCAAPVRARATSSAARGSVATGW